MSAIIETIQRLADRGAKLTPLSAFGEGAWYDFMCDERISPTVSCNKDNLEYVVPINGKTYIVKFRVHSLDGYYLESVHEWEAPKPLPFDELPSYDKDYYGNTIIRMGRIFGEPDHK